MKTAMKKGQLLLYTYVRACTSVRAYACIHTHVYTLARACAFYLWKSTDGKPIIFSKNVNYIIR